METTITTNATRALQQAKDAPYREANWTQDKYHNWKAASPEIKSRGQLERIPDARKPK